MHAGRAEQLQVLLSGCVEQGHGGWDRHTQSHRVVSKRWRVEVHRALASGRQEHERALKTNPQPHCRTVGHLHWQDAGSKTCGEVHRGKSEHWQVAFTGRVLHRHWGVDRHWQSHTLLLNACRTEVHLAAGFGTHEQDWVLKTNPHPHACTEGHLHWHATGSNT